MPRAHNPQVGHLSAALAVTTRHHGPDDPRVIELRRDLKVAKLADHIRDVVDSAPPLLPEHVERLRALLPAPTATLDGGGQDAA